MGANAITAAYAGDANNEPATSNTLNPAIAPSTLTLPGGGGVDGMELTGPAGCTIASPTFGARAHSGGMQFPLGVFGFTAGGPAATGPR